MSFDSSLADSTRRNTFGLLVLYSAISGLLYWPTGCSSVLGYYWCNRIVAVREDLVDWLGRDWLTILWLLSGFVGFTLDRSGTQSGSWKGLGYVLLVIFAIGVVVRILSILLRPL